MCISIWHTIQQTLTAFKGKYGQDIEKFGIAFGGEEAFSL